MGRKKKKALKPWCWYCNRDFDDEKILIQHQKAKHFKCMICHKKLYTGPGLAIHCTQVHKETVSAIPNSLPNRGDPEIEIYGMEGIPDKDLKERQQKQGKEESDEPPVKKAKDDTPQQMMGMPVIPGAMPMMPMGVPGMAVLPGFPPPMPMPVMPGHPMPGHPMPGHPMPGIPHMQGIPRPPLHVPMPIMPRNIADLRPPMSATSTVSAPRLQVAPGALQYAPAIGPQVPASKPLFPAAQNVNGTVTTTASSGPVGADFKPLVTDNSFSTYQSGPTIAGVKPVVPPPVAVPVVIKPAIVVPPGATSKLIHPDEDISLEEKRASLSKYTPKTQSLPTSNIPTMPVNPMLRMAAPPTNAVPPMPVMSVSAPTQQPLMSAQSTVPSGYPHGMVVTSSPMMHPQPPRFPLQHPPSMPQGIPYNMLPRPGAPGIMQQAPMPLLGVPPNSGQMPIQGRHMPLIPRGHPMHRMPMGGHHPRPY